MSAFNPSKYLKEGEGVIAVFRRHPFALARSLVVPLAFLLADFFFLSWLVALGPWGVAAFTVVLLLSLASSVRTLIVWHLDVFLVTDRRVIDVDQHGFFHKTVSETTYEKMQDIRFQVRGVWQTVFRFGAVMIQTAGSEAVIDVRDVRDPQSLQELLVRVQEEAGERRRVDEPTVVAAASSQQLERLTATLRAIRAEIGAEAFRELLEREFPLQARGKR